MVTPRKLIKSKENWVRFALATDANDISVPIYTKDAVNFCLLGAATKTVDLFFAKHVRRNLVDMPLINCIENILHTALIKQIDLPEGDAGPGLVIINDFWVSWQQVDEVLDETNDEIEQLLKEAENANTNTPST